MVFKAKIFARLGYHGSGSTPSPLTFVLHWPSEHSSAPSLAQRLLLHDTALLFVLGKVVL